MAIINKINLNGDTYDIQDTATLQAVENVTDAVDGKSTADITYNTTAESLVINTAKITVSPSSENNSTLAEDGEVKAISLNGTVHKVGGGGGKLYIYKATTFPAMQSGEIINILARLYVNLTSDELNKVQITIITGGSLAPQVLFTTRTTPSDTSGNYDLLISCRNTGPAIALQLNATIQISVYVPDGDVIDIS